MCWGEAGKVPPLGRAVAEGEASGTEALNLGQGVWILSWKEERQWRMLSRDATRSEACAAAAM